MKKKFLFNDSEYEAMNERKKNPKGWKEDEKQVKEKEMDKF